MSLMYCQKVFQFNEISGDTEQPQCVGTGPCLLPASGRPQLSPPARFLCPLRWTHPGTSSTVMLHPTERPGIWLTRAARNGSQMPLPQELDCWTTQESLHSWPSLAPTWPIRTDFLLRAILEVPAGPLNFWDLLWTAKIPFRWASFSSCPVQEIPVSQCKHKWHGSFLPLLPLQCNLHSKTGDYHELDQTVLYSNRW